MPTLGIDIGTQSLKAVVLDDELRRLGSGSVSYQPSFPRPGWAEQDPTLWLEGLGPAIARALSAAGLTPDDIDAMSICGQLDGCIPTDNDGAALAPAIIWMDRRGSDLLAAIDPATISQRCGIVLDATHMGGKIAWFAANLPDPARVRTWHQPVSFALEALTGTRAMSPSLASTTMMYELGAQNWSDDLAGMFGAEQRALPELCGEAEVAGRLTSAGALLTGLPRGLPIATGTGDDFSNMIGTGIGSPGVLAVSIGTAEAVGTLSSAIAIDPQMLVETHAFPGGLFHLGNPGWMSGGAVRWAMSLLSVVDDVAFMSLAAGAPPGCDGLIFVPALSGAMAPKWIANARAGFVGLTSSHGPAHMARSVLEGTAFAMRDVSDRLDALGAGSERLRIMGGGARGQLWCQIRADLVGRPVDALREGDASATGAALLASVGAGHHSSIAEATSALALPAETIDPDPRTKDRYDGTYRMYRNVFAALEPVWSIS